MRALMVCYGAVLLLAALAGLLSAATPGCAVWRRPPQPNCMRATQSCAVLQGPCLVLSCSLPTPGRVPDIAHRPHQALPQGLDRGQRCGFPALARQPAAGQVCAGALRPCCCRQAALKWACRSGAQRGCAAPASRYQPSAPSHQQPAISTKPSTQRGAVSHPILVLLHHLLSRDHFTVSIESLRQGRVWTALTAAFSHADFMHFAANMIGAFVGVEGRGCGMRLGLGLGCVLGVFVLW